MPFSLLRGVSDPKLLDLFSDIEVLDSRIGALRTEFLDTLWEELRFAVKGRRPDDGGAGAGVSFRALLRVHRSVEAAEPLDDGAVSTLTAASGLCGAQESAGRWERVWSDTARRRADLHRRARAVLADSTRDAQRTVAARFDSPLLRHAAFVSNPRFFSTALGTGTHALTPPEQGAPPRGLRRRLATAHRYLRRFASRCETVSFFGPVLYADLDEGLAEALHVGEPVPERVVVEASSWLVRALQERATRDSAPERLRVWRRPLFRAVEQEYTLRSVLDGRLLRLPPPLWSLWEHADGRTAGEIAAGLGMDPDEAATGLRRLAPLLTTAAHRVPSVELRPLDSLLAAVGADSDAGRFAPLLEGYALEPWPGRGEWAERIRTLAEETGLDTARGNGGHYADRELYYEDRTSPFSERVRLGAPAVEGICRALRAVMPIAYLGALLAREDARDAVRPLLAGPSRSLAALAAAETGPGGSRLRRMRGALADLVSSLAEPGARVVDLDSRQVDRVVGPLWNTVPEEDRWDPCLPSPDLMASGLGDGSGTWVLSELHDDCSSVYGGLERRLHSDPDEVWGSFVRQVASFVDPGGAATIVSRRRSAHVTPELPGLSLELSGASEKPAESVRPIADAEVSEDGRRVEVDGRSFQLYPGDLSSALHRAVSLPSVVPVDVDTGAFTPRVTIDGVVYQRARWSLELPERSADAFDRWLGVQRLRSRAGMPRHVFARHPDEAKPLYVDFADPLSVDDLARLPAGTVVFTEMLPGPEELWWDAPGEPQCAELRLGCLVRAVPDQSQSLRGTP